MFCLKTFDISKLLMVEKYGVKEVYPTNMKTTLPIASKSRAFTLIEVCILMAIIGLLAAIVIPNAMKARESRRELERWKELVASPQGAIHGRPIKVDLLKEEGGISAAYVNLVVAEDVPQLRFKVDGSLTNAIATVFEAMKNGTSVVAEFGVPSGSPMAVYDPLGEQIGGIATSVEVAANK